MTPYSSFLFFILLGILLLPTIILGLNGKRFQAYNMFISIIILALIFSHDLHGVIALCLFTIWQVLLISGYLAYRAESEQWLCLLRSCYRVYSAFISVKNMAVSFAPAAASYAA